MSNNALHTVETNIGIIIAIFEVHGRWKANVIATGRVMELFADDLELLNIRTDAPVANADNPSFPPGAAGVEHPPV